MDKLLKEQNLRRKCAEQLGRQPSAHEFLTWREERRQQKRQRSETQSVPQVAVATQDSAVPFREESLENEEALLLVNVLLATDEFGLEHFLGKGGVQPAPYPTTRTGRVKEVHTAQAPSMSCSDASSNMT